MQSRSITKVLLLITLLACSVATWAQTITGGVNGTVTDPSGAVVPNAKVTATNVDTGVTTSSITNNDGIYSIRFLQIGTYKVVIAAPGFTVETFGPFKIETGQNARIDAKLMVEGSNQNVLR